MAKGLVVVALMMAAQILPSCDGMRPPASDQGEGVGQVRVIGWVDEKRVNLWLPEPYVLVINHHEYPSPYDFWRTVEIGDLVRWDGVTWTIVRRARR
jgi:hypothetical protein